MMSSELYFNLCLGFSAALYVGLLVFIITCDERHGGASYE